MVIRLKNMREIGHFVDCITVCDDSYSVTARCDPVKSISARSLIGVCAMAMADGGELVLVNHTRAGHYPDSVRMYAI